MRRYTQLTREQRHQIYALMKAGHNQSEIAMILGRGKSTISRELGRNRGLRGYRPRQAHHLAEVRQRNRSPRRVTDETWSLVKQLLCQDWSPEQISGWLKRECGLSVSHEWIYQYVYADKRQGGDLYRHLRCQKQRRKRYGSYSRRGQLRGRVSIDERPEVVERRSRYGDWEVDTIIGKGHKQAIVSLTERRARLTLLAKVQTREAKTVGQAAVQLLTPVADRVHTITADNGKEFAEHEMIAQALEANFYFAHPYASWERGLNENTNGLVRQYFPKQCHFDRITDEEIQTVIDKLNNRPRKCLGFKTPNEVFFGMKPTVALAS
jgi:IS30 family transposase